MTKQVLILINIALAIAASIFIYQMLPYAAAIGCGDLNPVPNCQPLTQTKLLLYAVVPLVLVCAIAFCSVRLFSMRHKLSKGLLFVVPVWAILLGVYIFVLSATQP
ncbi:MAG: hypothetical protein KKF22_11510 [Gammaproteobacteria bacterium]|nr:hypothetical protein [Gammaproteobacteria bacterium]